MENQWQPIETCPENVRVFVWLRSTTDSSYGRRLEATKLQGTKYGWDCGNQDWVLADLIARDIYFSHWMPLPKPPVINN